MVIICTQIVLLQSRHVYMVNGFRKDNGNDVVLM